MERMTVSRGIVEPLISLELVVSEAVETGIRGNLRTQPDHPVEDLID
ncbi:MAG TPA: hypothetical protein PLL20_03630 [Phycisphaerae bacterium]|nr:hypothetical protein [Phycisphaerae bacterium]HRR87101.1 hypothetical protein [Phycisphaerae bacterium]